MYNGNITKVSDIDILGEVFVFACSKGRLSLVRSLLEDSVINVDYRDKNGYTALLIAVDQGKKKVVLLRFFHTRVSKHGGTFFTHWLFLSRQKEFFVLIS